MALKKWVSKGEGIKNWEKGEFASSTSMKVLKPLCMIYVYAKELEELIQALFSLVVCFRG